jgi:hypothetical protein
VPSCGFGADGLAVAVAVVETEVRAALQWELYEMENEGVDGR